MDIKELQQRIIRNKINHGFEVGNINQEFLLLYGEVAEAYSAYLINDKDNLAEEFADVMIYLLGLTDMLNIDLEQAVNAKLAKNERREYKRLDNGTFVKIEKE